MIQLVNFHYIFSDSEWKRMYPSTEYTNKSSHACQHVLHFLLGQNQSDKSLIEYIQKHSKSDRSILFRQDLRNHGLTPLIIATMRLGCQKLQTLSLSNCS